MKAKKFCQVCLVVCGLVLALMGIACLVVATLLDHDSDLSISHESKSRTYHTQYWLGLPIIAFGGYLMLISLSLHKKKQLAAITLFLCIPLITCTLVSAILHGTAYSYFNALYQNRVFLEDHSYACGDGLKDASTHCICSKPDKTALSANNINLPVSCAQQKSLFSHHGSLLAFSVIIFALLLGVLVICIIFLLNFFKLQLAMNTTIAARNNDGFSHIGGRGDNNIDRNTEGSSSSHHASQSTLIIPQDSPPSYDSLVPPFNMSHGLTLHGSAPFPNNISQGRERISAVNNQARPVRVRYRGQLSTSRLNNEIPVRSEHGETQTNDDSDSNELQNAQAQTDVNNESVTSNNESFSGETRQERQVNDQQNNTESRPNVYNQSNRVREGITASDNRIEPRSEQNGSEPTIEVRRSGQSVRNNHSFPEPSGQISSQEGTNFSEPIASSRNLDLSSGQSNEIINATLIRNDSNRSDQPPSAEHSSEMGISIARRPSGHMIGDYGHVEITYERENSIGQIERNSPARRDDTISQETNIRNTNSSSDCSVEVECPESELSSHPSLERTISNNSEDGIYIDITQNSPVHSNSVLGNDADIAVRYTEPSASGSIQTSSQVNRKQDTIVQRAAHQERTNNSSNSVGSDATSDSSLEIMSI